MCCILFIVLVVFGALYQISLFFLLLHGLGYIMYELWKELNIKRFLQSCFIVFKTTIFKIILFLFIIILGIVLNKN